MPRITPDPDLALRPGRRPKPAPDTAAELVADIQRARAAVDDYQQSITARHAELRDRRAAAMAELRGTGLSLRSIQKRVGRPVRYSSWLGNPELEPIPGPELESREERETRRDRLVAELRLLADAPQELQRSVNDGWADVLDARYRAIKRAQHAGMTQHEIADALGVNFGTFCTWVGFSPARRERHNRRKR